jgi:UDP-4-amino-4-deoxy-L-arabinose formyltransferase / UDP-glucuronic acid dehydrogenase (UDP-4-keto-hexauronic acid decarboxylating)
MGFSFAQGVTVSVVLFGYHTMGCIALKVLQELDISVPGVFTHQDDPGENRWFDSLAEKSRQIGIPVYFPEDLQAPKWLDVIRELAPDILLSCYYRHMIREEILAIPRLAAVNLHGSLLPRYRGRCPINWQLIHGESEAGVTLHHMVRRADAGDIVGQRSVTIAEGDTALTLFRKLEPAAEELLRVSIPLLLNGTAPRIPQDHSRASYFGGRRPEDGRIQWNWPGRRIYNLIRAVTRPYPGAFTFLAGRKLMIWWAEPLDEEHSNLAAGTVLASGAERLVQTGQGLLRLIEVGEADQSARTMVPLSELLRHGDRLS